MNPMRSSAEVASGEPVQAALRRYGYTIEGTTFPTQRPDRTTLSLRTRSGLPAVAKILPPERAAQVFTNMEQLWRSSFGGRRQPPGLPQPLQLLPEIGAVVVERVDGQPLAELGPVTDLRLEGAMRLLVSLHGCDAVPETRRSSRGIVRSMQRKLAMIAQLAPQHASAVAPLIEALEARRPKDTELVPSHGDFSPRNVLMGRERCVLLDWDRFQRADPARDVTYFAIHDWRERLRRGRWPDHSLLEKAIGLYKALRPGADFDQQLGFHIAAGLTRMAASLVQLWPEEAWLVPALAKVALRELEEGADGS